MTSLNRRIERIEKEQEQTIIQPDDPICQNNSKADMIVGKTWQQVEQEMAEWVEHREVN